MPYIPVAVVGSSGGTGSFTNISTQELGSSSATIAFSSIPGTYRTLYLSYIARGTAAATSVGINLQFNGDAGNNYEREILSAVGTTVAAATSGSTNSIASIGEIAAGSASAGRMGSGQITIPGYAQTAFFKAANGVCGDLRGSGAADQVIFFSAGVWLSTAAITSISLSLSSGSFDTGSIVSLYGMS